MFLKSLAGASDAELLREDRAIALAFSEFYRRHVDAVLRLCAVRSLSPDDAADVAAETFLAALRARHGYNPDRGDARAWLFGIVEHKIRDMRRCHARRVETQRRVSSMCIALTARDTADYAALRSEVEQVREALTNLPADQRAVVAARLLVGDSYADIGDRMNITAAAARQRAHRGLAQIKLRFQDKT